MKNPQREETCGAGLSLRMCCFSRNVFAFSNTEPLLRIFNTLSSSLFEKVMLLCFSNYFLRLESKSFYSFITT